MKALDDTIAAVATAAGEGGIAIVRVSGPLAGALAWSLVRDSAGEPVELPPRAVRWGRVVDPASDRVTDEVLALWMPGPSSYTREDVLEIHCHGGRAAACAVLDLALAGGARLAEPGEFTLRAFLRGRIDLIQAEAVVDTIQAQTGEALRVHEELLEGRLSAVVQGWQENLGRALAEIETHLDFAEEDVGELRWDRVDRILGEVRTSMGEKLRTYSWGRAAREGFRVALVGSPNTGKSSLLNYLAGEDCAIVSPLPGTTRDAIEVRVNALGAPVRVVDTAGLRDAGDEIEAEGVRRTRKLAAGADLVVLVCDGARKLSSEEEREAVALAASGRSLGVVNKRDLGLLPRAKLAEIYGCEPITVSARRGEGVEELLRAFRAAAWRGKGVSAEAPLTRHRQRVAVEGAAKCLDAASARLGRLESLEIVASDLQAARARLRELVGWGAAEDVLERIFAEFCIGK